MKTANILWMIVGVVLGIAVLTLVLGAFVGHWFDEDKGGPASTTVASSSGVASTTVTSSSGAASTTTAAPSCSGCQPIPTTFLGKDFTYPFFPQCGGGLNLPAGYDKGDNEDWEWGKLLHEGDSCSNYSFDEAMNTFTPSGSGGTVADCPLQGIWRFFEETPTGSEPSECCWALTEQGTDGKGHTCAPDEGTGKCKRADDGECCLGWSFDDPESCYKSCDCEDADPGMCCEKDCYC